MVNLNVLNNTAVDYHRKGLEGLHAGELAGGQDDKFKCFQRAYAHFHLASEADPENVCSKAAMHYTANLLAGDGEDWAEIADNGYSLRMDERAMGCHFFGGDSMNRLTAVDLERMLHR